jgi:hypothetical protein
MVLLPYLPSQCLYLFPWQESDKQFSICHLENNLLL